MSAVWEWFRELGSVLRRVVSWVNTPDSQENHSYALGTSRQVA